MGKGADGVGLLAPLIWQEDKIQPIVGAIPHEAGLVPTRRGERKPVVAKRDVISVEELERHCTASDCWIAIEGQVYEATEWLKLHPGGDICILNMAGQDATDAFRAFHKPMVSKFHLPRFHVGPLAAAAPPSKMLQEYRQLAKDLESSELFQTRPSFYLSKALVIAALFALVVAGVTLTSSPWVHLASGLLLGLFWQQCAFVGHDTGHLSITRTRSLDNLIGLFVGNVCTGIGILWWKRTHNVHHIACNNVQYDPDIQHIPLFAVSEKYFASLYSFYHKRQMNFDRAARVLVSYQHWTFYPIMAVARWNLWAQTWILLLSGPHTPDKTAEIAALMVFYGWLASLMSFIPSWPVRIGFLCAAVALSGILHVQICLSHFPMPVYDGHVATKDYVQMQLDGTMDIDCPTWLDWFHGGLQFQVEHHLFPRLPRHNLRRVKGTLRAFCKKHGLRYTSVPFWEANRLIIKCLRQHALEARDLSKPLPPANESLLWDALNAQG
ncbi:Sphingobase-D8 Desaturase [Klebsormidium nitens]|uniref:Sphingobase-D8 Desaturase n=1 Tax=Klebsormidium nitens TaxID=105231 RepID=A0A1Y1HRW9_KLENI|nr:Sphingobase-D8 Desaturase [Klebsormidium nitens]|eukprot:GAQ79919.1 Sphingobase-D8 Desaturase [Klebsormidium nitens]